MADELKIFQAGDKITADETNDNNRYLLGVAQDTSGELQNYIDTQLNQFQNNLNTQISSINTQIAEVTALANTKISATKSNASNGFCKLSNGLIIQWHASWGWGNGTVQWVTWATPFSGWYQVVGSTNYEQTAGDKGSSWAVRQMNNAGAEIRSEFGQSGHGDCIRLIAIGY